jgi:L-2,4-diaminobutyrate transaminase
MEEGADRIGAFSHGYTHSGHPIGVAAANAVLDIVERENLGSRGHWSGVSFAANDHDHATHSVFVMTNNADANAA